MYEVHKCVSCGQKAPPGTKPKDGEVLLCPDCSEGLIMPALLTIKTAMATAALARKNRE